MVNFATQTLQIQGETVIDHGMVKPGYSIPTDHITWPVIEKLYSQYNDSVPENELQPALCVAKAESELTLHELVFGIRRSQAQDTFEQTLLFGILNGSLQYPTPEAWFWQSPRYKNLIIPRWIFEPNAKAVQHRTERLRENELWDRNVAARKLRNLLNEDTTQHITWNKTFRHCFLTIKEELAEKTSHRHFTDDIISSLCRAYMHNLPKRYLSEKTTIGQHIASLKRAKSSGQKLRALDNILQNCPMYPYEYDDSPWDTAYSVFVNRKTLEFIYEFIPTVSVPDFSNLSDAAVEQYVLDNKTAICNYINTH